MILSARSSRLVNSPRRSTFRVRIENQISTMFSQDAWVGVWWTWNRGGAKPRLGDFGGVTGSVVHDQMDVQVVGNRLVDLGEELDERHRVVPFDDVAQDGAVDDVHRGHQRNGPVAAVLEFPPGRPAGGHCDGRVLARLGLDTGLFVDAE